ncbi:hypothetical protein ALO79_200314 [Pseudomonas syringae pv. castaneae]|uniref:Uncharacterized protein n=1 Tax=Pseudomonas syringae pv. castaneae TaxID=264450 RepID=A0A0P9MF29_PSESX|nr:hypothetical protein ALO79_200314 [Pseudomonas syringae pv. castaneae]
MDQARRTHPELTGLRPQALGQCRIHALLHFFDATAVALHIQQTERQRRFVDVTQHVAEERFVLFATHAQPGLGDMIAVRHSRCEQLCLVQQAGLHFMHHHLKGGVVQRHVMEQQHADPTLVRQILGIGQPHQRCLGNVEAVVTRVEAFVQLLHCIARRRIQPDFFKGQRRVAPDHLHR